MEFIDWTAGAGLIGALLFLGGAAYAFRRRVYRLQAARLAIPYALLAALWALEHYLHRMGLLDFLDADFLTRLPLYGLVILGFVFLLLTRALLGSNTPLWPWLVSGLIGLGATAALEPRAGLAIPTTLQIGRFLVPRTGLAVSLLIAGWAAFTVGAVLQTDRSLRLTSRYATLVSHWAIVLTLVVVGGGLYFANLHPLGLALWMLGSLFAIYVSVAPRLPEVGHILRDWLSRFIYRFLAALVYSLIFLVTYLLLRGQLGARPLWLALAVGLVMALVVDPLLNRLRKRLKRWNTGEHRDTAGLLRQYSQSITNILDLNLLATVAVGTASELLDVKRGFVFLVDHEKGADGRNHFQIRGVKGMGETDAIPGRLREDSPLATFFRYEYQPITQAEIYSQARFRGLYDEELAWLDKLGVDVMVPIYAKNEWIGLLALGTKGSGREYSTRELGLLSMIADQTAVALENIRLVEGLVRLNNDFRRAYSALDQANRNLERLDKTKSDFISISSHELRTPLTLISGASQMLLDDPDLQNNPYYKQLLGKMHTGTVRLHEIVDAMLDVAKIDTRALELEPQPVSLNSLIRGVCVDLRKDLDDRKQTLEMQNLEDLPSVPADMQALRKVFYHVIVNAVKYTPDGGRIKISGRKLEPNNADLRTGGVEVLISDTGIGIDPRFHDLIFTKFYQTGELALHSTGKTKFKGGGPGLGLAIARGIVEAHRGRIWVESPGYSEENCPGSTFHIVLPIRPLS